MKTINLRTALLLAVTLIVSGCAQQTKTEVTVMDFNRASGVYVLVYSTDQQMRARFEDQLVADLTARDIKAFSSYSDLPDVGAATRDDLVRAANARRAMFVLVVEEVGQGDTGVVASAGRITQENQTLQDFYENSQPSDRAYDEQAQVFVEASAFLLQGDRGKLVWSGTAWPVSGAGDPMPGLSETIANAIEKARRDLAPGRG